MSTRKLTLLPIILILSTATLKAQLIIETSFSMMNDIDYNWAASGTRGLGPVPNMSSVFPFGLSLLIEKKMHVLSPYVAAQFVQRKINVEYRSFYGTGGSSYFLYQTLEIPVGLRMRKKVNDNSCLRASFGAGTNYIVSPGYSIKIDDYNTFSQVKAKPAFFAQGGIGFECEVSPRRVFSASINYQRQLTRLFSFYNTYSPPGFTMDVSSEVRPHYFSMSVSFAFLMK